MTSTKSTWSTVTPAEVASWFEGKRSGWRPTPIACAAISSWLDWLLLENVEIDKFFAKQTKRPERQPTDAPRKANALIREIEKIISGLQEQIDFDENMHMQKGADPARRHVTALLDLKNAVNSAAPLLKNPKAARESDDWRVRIRSIYQIINFAATQDGRTNPLSINGEAHLACVIAGIMERAGYTCSPAQVADACNDQKLKRAIVGILTSTGAILRRNG